MATTVQTPPRTIISRLLDHKIDHSYHPHFEDLVLKPFTNILPLLTGFTLLAVVLLLIHISIPQAEPYTSKFLLLSHRQPSTGLYSIGNGDVCFVLFEVLTLVGLREGCMKYLLAPFARVMGVSKERKVVRFSEQGWVLMYYSQVISVNIEARRKDYWLNVVHHFITITLIILCYVYHHTRVGSLILVMMDAIEILFPFAKCLRYLGFTTLCDVVFCIFFITWIISRHVLYLMTCWSVYSDVPRIIEPSCFMGSANDLNGPLPVPNDWWHLIEPWLYPKGRVCHSDNFRVSILAYLLVLQVLMMIWFGFICKVAIGVLRGRTADDVRSDVESDEEDSKSVANGSGWQQSQLQPGRCVGSNGAAQMVDGGKNKIHCKEE
ncbi:fumonisin biosynthetic ceramide synthase [Fusarium phyllophilum]|uniref:Fumonisin biosynthetic ceramide synthase n=1 Tax=Fusarium phyllophilum TaxID=47803 RepID=A0A8H5NPL1_9HYPO|nr:fumonisin biosynthetic ceramide synthase [Fusarium phyllophilum]